MFFCETARIGRAVNELQLALAAGDETSLVADATDSPEAHKAYLRGRYFWNQRTEESIRDASSEFRRAIELDSAYAEAYSGLADAYLLMDAYASTPDAADYRENIQRGLTAAREAVRHEPALGMARASSALGLWTAGRWEDAEEEFGRALELNAGYAPAHLWHALHLSTTGRSEEAVARARRAMELDPVSPIVSLVLGQALWEAGRAGEALEQQRETVRLAPDRSIGWLYLAMTLLEAGEQEAASEAFVRSAGSADGDVEAATRWAQAMARFRETGEPQAVPGAFGGDLVRTTLHAHAGQIERAVGLREEMVRSGAHGPVAQVHTFWHTGRFLADDPRYAALLQEAGITW